MSGGRKPEEKASPPPQTLTLGGPDPGLGGVPPTRTLAGAPAPQGTLTLGGPSGTAAGSGAALSWTPGQVVDDLYEVFELLGEGGFGTVHRVHHRVWDLDLAVKAPRADRVANRRALELFVQEANTWVGLGLHPHIATCYFVRLMGVPRIFIEYMGGKTLSDWLKKDRVQDMKAALDFAVQIARGMDYAHSKGLVHRDLKPGNCLMTLGGGLKITDFGLAKVDAGEEPELPAAEVGAKIAKVKEATQTGRLGTPEHMAPEQWDRPREAGRAADAWAFGVLLYELCCGKRPFAMDDDEPVDAFYARLLRSNWRYEKPRGLPAGVGEMIAGCLSEEAAKRPADFKAMGAALEQAYENTVGAKYAREAARPTLLADTLNNQGVSMADLGRTEEALRLFDEALKLDPTHPGAICNRGALLLSAGKLAEGELLARLGQAKNARPGDWSAPYLLGLVHLRRKDARAAIEALEEAQALSHHHQNPLVAKARSRAEAGAFEAPLELFVALPTGAEGAAMGEAAFKALLARAEKELIANCFAQAQESALKARQVKGYERATEAVSFLRRLGAKGARKSLRGAWQKRLLEGSEGALSVALSPDGKFLLSGHAGNVLKRWDVDSGVCVETGKGGGAPTTRCPTPDKRFAVEAAGKSLSVLEQPSQRRVAEFDAGGEVAAVCLSPDGCAAYAAGKGGVRVWELDWEYAFAEGEAANAVAAKQATGFKLTWEAAPRIGAAAGAMVVLGLLVKFVVLAPPNAPESAEPRAGPLALPAKPAESAPSPAPPAALGTDASAASEEAQRIARAFLEKGGALKDPVEGLARLAVVKGLNAMLSEAKELAAAGKAKEAGARIEAAVSLAKALEEGETLMDAGKYAQAAAKFSAAVALPGGDAARKLLDDARSRPAKEQARRAEEARKAAIQWVTIPGGSFTMGADDVGPDARPRHRVAVRTFQMAKTLVTVEQYKACVDAGACAAPNTGAFCNWGQTGRERHPINCVDWNQAQAFSSWAGGRLPSEAEWEYAARSAGKDWKYPWGDEHATCERAVMNDRGLGCGRNSTWPVCSKPVGNTEQGLCDMAGNAWEWTQDWYHNSYNRAPDDGSAWENPAGSARVYRGDSWSSVGSLARASSRQGGVPGGQSGNLGFRPARSR